MSEPFSYIMDATFLTLVSGLLTLICVSLFLRHRNIYSYWKRLGIKGPKPLPIIGCLHTSWTQDGLKNELEFVNKYGKIYGTYHGTKPVLVVADPDVASQIYIKDFDCFPNYPKLDSSNRYIKHFLFALRDDFWRYVRVLMSPTFSSGKIKRMFKFFNACADDLVEVFAEELARSKTTNKDIAIVNLRQLYSLFTLDTITTCCYGMKLERHSGQVSITSLASRNDFVAAILKIFDLNIWRIVIVYTVPTFILKFFEFAMIPNSSIDPIAKRVGQLIASRRKSKKKFDDYLQLLLDARLEDKLELDEMDMKENHHAGLSKESLMKDQKKMLERVGKSRNGLTDTEVLGSAVFLIVVGLDTTASTLAHCSYALAFHQEVQEKLYQEIMKIAEYEKDKKLYNFSYEALTSCEYLDAVISESLRLLSPSVYAERESATEYHIEKYNVTIPAGSHVRLIHYVYHNSPDYWKEPSKFDPDRFMPPNKEQIYPHSYAPFGLGPRHCIGMRFSLSETKLAIAKVIANYELYPSPGSVFPGKPRAPTNPLYNLVDTSVIVKSRSKR